MVEIEPAWLTRAKAALGAGKLAEAARVADEGLRQFPDSVDARLVKAIVAVRQGQNEVAATLFHEVRERRPDSFEAAFWMSVLARRKGAYLDAVEFARHAEAADPTSPIAKNNLGICLTVAGKPAEASVVLRASAALRPGPEVFYNLGTALFQMGDAAEAAAAFGETVRLRPESPDGWLSLGQSLLLLNRFDEALVAAERTQSLQRSVEAELLIASVSSEMGQMAASEEALRNAISLGPKDASSMALVGHRLQALGDFEQANRWLRRAIECDPTYGFSYFAYIFNVRVSEDDRALIDAMHELLSRKQLAPTQRAQLAYGLGRAHEMLGEYDPARQAYETANALTRDIRFKNLRFDAEGFAKALIRNANQCPEVPSVAEGSPCLFVVGTMRSGTTLVEQMLSRHPLVAAGGECQFWADRREHLLAGKPGLGEAYAASIAELAEEKRWVTDKLPANLEVLGQLLIANPGARAIHMVRDPRDVAVSIFTTPNRVPIRYANDLSDLGAAIRAYSAQAEIWRSRIPSGRLLEVSYERLVSDSEPELRRVLEFLDLEWNDAVLNPERNRRAVVTPSLWQVRQPVNRGSIGRWRRFETWLERLGFSATSGPDVDNFTVP